MTRLSGTVLVATVFALVCGFWASALAQPYPTRPVRLVLPFPPGGGTDALARIIGPRLAETLGQSVVIDNRSGAAAVLAGEVQMLFGSVASSLPHVQAGRLRALATSGNQRHPLAPDLPTIEETGFPGFNVSGWDSVLAPAGTPSTIIGRLNAELVRIVRLPEVRESLARVGYQATGTTPAALSKIIADESAMWTKVIREANIRVD